MVDVRFEPLFTTTSAQELELFNKFREELNTLTPDTAVHDPARISRFLAALRRAEARLAYLVHTEGMLRQLQQRWWIAPGDWWTLGVVVKDLHWEDKVGLGVFLGLVLVICRYCWRYVLNLTLIACLGAFCLTILLATVLLAIENQRAWRNEQGPRARRGPGARGDAADRWFRNAGVPNVL